MLVQIKNTKKLKQCTAIIIKLTAIGGTLVVSCSSPSPIVSSLINAVVWGAIEVHSELRK